MSHNVILFNFLRTTKLVFTVDIPFYIPTSNAHRFQFLHILVNIYHCLFFNVLLSPLVDIFFFRYFHVFKQDIVQSCWLACHFLFLERFCISVLCSVVVILLTFQWEILFLSFSSAWEVKISLNCQLLRNVQKLSLLFLAWLLHSLTWRN